jgi:GntR family transcriptional regulator
MARVPTAELFGGPLNRDSPTPIFVQIRQRIEQALDDGALEPNQRIPSERELSEILGVSRVTVRQALDAMTAGGRLYSLPGKGTFVSRKPVIEQPLLHLTSFTQDIRERGMRPSSRLIESELVRATFEVSRLFGIGPQSEIYRLVRLRLADDEPLAVETSHIPVAYAPGLFDVDLSRVSLYETLTHQYGLQPVSAHQTIEAAEATPDERTLLFGSAPPYPILRTSRLTSDSAERVIEYTRAVYRGDRYHLSVELR